MDSDPSTFIENGYVEMGYVKMSISEFLSQLKGEGQVLMQSTGLTDKNGREIFEGDVVNYGQYTDNAQPCNFIVVWDEKHAEFAEQEIRKFGNERLAAFDSFGEVIGNIYEHPDLLPTD